MVTTGHEKNGITAALTATSDGRKLKPFVLLDRKRPIPELVKKYPDLVIEFAGTSWMNDSLTDTYLRKVIKGRFFNDKRLLVWDAFRCHISDKTKAVLKELEIETAIVPGGCTKFIQVYF